MSFSQTLMDSQLTHRDLELLVQGGMSRRKISKARNGNQEHRDSLMLLLENLPEALLQESFNKVNDLRRAQIIIDMGLDLLQLEGTPANREYVDLYKRYIDLKVEYNQLGKEPKNHAELIRVHALVRRQNEEAKKLLKVPA